MHGGGRRSSAGGGLTLIRTQSAEDRRRAAAARRDVRKEEVEQRALSAELSAVQRQLTAYKQAGAAPTAAGGILAVTLSAGAAASQIDSIRQRHDKGHGKWPAHVSLLMAVPSLSAEAQMAVARAVAAEPPLLLTFTAVAAHTRKGRADGRTHVTLVLSEESAGRLIALQATVQQATHIAAQSSGSAEGAAYRPHLTVGQAPTRAAAVALAEQLQSELGEALPHSEMVGTVELWHAAAKTASCIFPMTELATLETQPEPEMEPEPEPETEPEQDREPEQAQAKNQRYDGTGRATFVEVIDELRNHPSLLPYRSQLGRLVTLTFFDRHAGVMSRPLYRFVLDTNDPDYYVTMRKSGDPIASSQHRFLQVHFNKMLVWDRGLPMREIMNSKGKVSYNIDSLNKKAKTIDRVLGSTGHTTMFDEIDSYVSGLTPDEVTAATEELAQHPEAGPQRFFVNVAVTGLAAELSAVTDSVTAHSSSYAPLCMDARCLHVSLCLLDLTGRQEQLQAQRALRSILPIISQLSPAGGARIDVAGVAAFPQGRGVYAKPTAASAEWLNRVGSIVTDAMTAAGLRARRHPPHISLVKTSDESRAAGVASIDEAAWVAFTETAFGSVAVETINLSASPKYMAKDAVTGFYHCLEHLPLAPAATTVAGTVESASGDAGGPLPPLDNRGGATTLRIFDFDGTLFRSPEPDPDHWTPSALEMLRRSTKNAGLGWFESPLSLSHPVVPQDAIADHFIDEVKAAAEESIANAATRTYVLTGRNTGCKPAVSALLATAGLEFEDVICKTAADKWKNAEYKKTWLAGLIKRHKAEYVEVWEDDPAIVRFLRSTFGDDTVRIYDVKTFVQHTATHLSAKIELDLVGKLITAASRATQVDVRPATAYSAVVLSAESKLRCRGLYQDSFGGLPGWGWAGDHMTINLGCLDAALNPAICLGEVVSLECRKIGWSERAVALRVRTAITSTGRTVVSGRGQTVQHVTLGCAPDAQARDANQITEWTAIDDVVELHGRVQEVCALVPPDPDTITKQAMLHMMVNHGGEVQSTVRSEVFTRLQGLCEHWRRTQAASESMLLVPVGSFAIGADFAADDIDVVVTTGCIAPSPETLKCLADYLAVSGGADAVRSVAAANGRRMLCLQLGGIDIDMLFSSKPIAPQTTLAIQSGDPEAVATALARADAFDVPELSSIRDTATIQQTLASLPETVTQALRFIKLWAKARAISNNKLGYVGGSGWTVMVLRVALEVGRGGCQTAPGLLRAFFARYARPVSHPIAIAGGGEDASSDAQRDLKRTGLSILTASPSHADGSHNNIARNSTTSTAARVWAELRRAHEYLSVATVDDESFFREVGPTLLTAWSKADFQREFDAMLRITLCDSASLDTIELLNSRLVHLALQLEGDGGGSTCYCVPLTTRKLRRKPTLRLGLRFTGNHSSSGLEESLASAWVDTTLRGATDELDGVELILQRML